MISGYSFLVSLIWFNLAMLLVALLRRRTSFLVKYSTSVLLLSAALGVLRMLLPLDLSLAHIIRSYEIMPAVRDFFASDVMPGAGFLRLSTLLFAVWIAGAVTVLAVMLRRMAAERNSYNSLTRVSNEKAEEAFKALNLKNARLTVSKAVDVPMVTGIVRANVFLPDIDLTREQWQLVIKHEYQHYLNHDSLIKLFYLALSALFWWNPVVHKYQKELDRLLELRCDAKVTEKMGDDERTDYLASILAVMKQLGGSGNGLPLAASPLVGARAESFSEQRFNVVLESDRRPRVPQVIVSVLLVAAFLFSYFVIIQPAELPEGNTAETGLEISPENAYILILEDGTKQLFVDGEFLWEVSDEEFVDELHSRLPIYERKEMK